VQVAAVCVSVCVCVCVCVLCLCVSYFVVCNLSHKSSLLHLSGAMYNAQVALVLKPFIQGGYQLKLAQAYEDE
jgi:hypothetical protein